MRATPHTITKHDRAHQDDSWRAHDLDWAIRHHPSGRSIVVVQQRVSGANDGDD